MHGRRSNSATKRVRAATSVKAAARSLLAIWRPTAEHPVLTGATITTRPSSVVRKSAMLGWLRRMRDPPRAGGQAAIHPSSPAPAESIARAPEALQVPDRHRKGPAFLITVARVQAAGSLKTVCEANPGFAEPARRPDLDAWQFYSTIAGVGTALMGLSVGHGTPAVQRLTENVHTAATAWHPGAWKGIVDFAAFVTDESDLPTALKVGMWVLWNARGTRPPEEDIAPATLIGTLIEMHLAGWFTSEDPLAYEATLEGVPDDDIEALIQVLSLKARAALPQ